MIPACSVFMGCCKVINYYAQKNPDLKGIILASPPDMVGLVELDKYQPNYKELLTEAETNVKKGEPRRLLSTPVWDYFNISSQTFLDLYKQGCPADILPLLRNPEHFEKLESLDVPVLGILGEYDDIEIRSNPEDLALIKEKATGCPSFKDVILSGANHCYENCEEALAGVVLEWVRGLS